MREGLTMTLNFQNDEGKQTSDKAGGTQKRMSHCIPRGLRYGTGNNKNPHDLEQQR
jgi:hypothetical protein